MNEPEQLLWSRLRDRRLGGWKFRRQAPLGPWVADFLSVDARVVVEVDGSQHASVDGAAHDAVRDQWMTKRGFRVYRFAVAEVMHDVDGVAERLMDAINALPPPRARGETG